MFVYGVFNGIENTWLFNNQQWDRIIDIMHTNEDMQAGYLEQLRLEDSDETVICAVDSLFKSVDDVVVEEHGGMFVHVGNTVFGAGPSLYRAKQMYLTNIP